MRTDHSIPAMRDIPTDLQAACQRIGGTNPYGHPLYRLVIAEKCLTEEAGCWQDWDPSIPDEERGGMVMTEIELETPEPIYTFIPGKGRQLVGYQRTKQVMMPSGARPLRTVAERRIIAKYPGKTGVVLERWYPPASYGLKEDWEAEKLPDGTPKLGAFPAQGEYEFISGPSPEMPTVTRIAGLINFFERNFEKSYSSPAQRRLERMAQAEDRRAKAEAKYKQEIVERLKENTGILLGSSLAAGRLRQEMADHAGLKGHFGN